MKQLRNVTVLLKPYVGRVVHPIWKSIDGQATLGNLSKMSGRFSFQMIRTGQAEVVQRVSEQGREKS
ncbi:MAG: hypothetical protein WCK09_14395 [Bacteroidota bacterium]